MPAWIGRIIPSKCLVRLVTLKDAASRVHSWTDLPRFLLATFSPSNCSPFATVDSTYTGIALLAANSAYFNVLVF